MVFQVWAGPAWEGWVAGLAEQHGQFILKEQVNKALILAAEAADATTQTIHAVALHEFAGGRSF